jgi:hypothetical protein
MSMMLSEKYKILLEQSKVFSKEEIDLSCNKNIFLKHTFYVNVINYFSALYKILDADSATRLSIITYSLFRSLLAFDKIIDDANSGEFKFALINYENAIRLLSRWFDDGHGFWLQFSIIKEKYFAALELEKEISKKKCISESEFILLSQGKSAFVEIAVVVMYEASMRCGHEEALLKSLSFLHIGMQYIDDIKDFREDIAHGQYTYIYSETIRLLVKLRVRHDGESPETLYKYMILSGLADSHYEKAIVAYRMAHTFVARIDVPEYKQFLLNEIAETEAIKEHTQNIVTRSRARTQVTYRINLDPVDDALNAPVTDAIDAALSFILEQRNADGTWQDFETDNGISVNWISAYVCQNLFDAGIPAQRFSASTDFLLSLPNSLFSFNDQTIQDGDSSTFFVSLIRQADAPLSDTQLASWIAFNDGNGGWRTYNPNTIKPVADGVLLDCIGWQSPHCCVSAVATLTLLRHFPLQQGRIEQALHYLLSKQESDGSWRAYWWSSDVYATAFALQALFKADERLPCQTSIARACTWLLAQQNSNGSWGVGDTCPFYTALAMKALLVVSPVLTAPLCKLPQTFSAIEQGARWLINAQLRNGGWLSGRSLRIPRPDIVDTRSVDKWRVAANGYNIVVNEQSGVFSTATVLNALTYFAQWNSVPTC